MLTVLLCVVPATLSAPTIAGETLYNGIVLPDQWPPSAKHREPRKPMAVPYLKHPPAVIPIDVGRQLFVDDFLIAKSTVKRTFHTARLHKANPVIKPDRAWEYNSGGWFAAPFSGGAWYDSKDKLFKIWYTGGYLHASCLATSKDGVTWNKPFFDVEKKTNIVVAPLDPKARRSVDTTSVWIDHDETDPKKRYKYFATEAGHMRGWAMVYRTSADGVHWTGPVAKQRIGGDRSTVFYNPFRKVWVLSERVGWGGRARAYCENTDPEKLINEGALTNRGKRTMWVSGDDLDPTHTVKELACKPSLYNLDAAPYESLMIGAFSIWQGPHNGDCGRKQLQKRNDILLGFSRDGFHWDRPNRKRFISCSWDEKSWRFGNVQSVASGCLIVGDKLHIYFSGRAKPRVGLYDTETSKTQGWDKDGATGLAILRRDGFASMDAGDTTGTLTTRPVTFKGKHLFVNADCPKGEIRVELLDEAGKVIAPFSAANCKPLSCDKTLAAITWTKGDLSTLAGKTVRFRFSLKNARLYSFWVSPDKSGASYGYVSAGGPGFTGATDTVGSAAY
jgi:hypothetical protein